MRLQNRTNVRPHEPFPIADMDVGEFSAKEPWLSPRNAFSDITDGFVYRSRLRRRGGFKRFAQLTTATGGLTIIEAGTDAESNYQVSSASVRVVGESVAFTWNDPVNGTINAECTESSWGFHDLNGTDYWGWEITETGTSTKLGVLRQSDGTQGAWATIDWTAHSDYTGTDVGGGAMTVGFKDPELPITGISNYRDTTGEEYLVACNTTDFQAYDDSVGYFKVPGTGSVTFTGSESDLFWFWPAGDDLIATNGVDPPQKYTGSSDTIAALTTTIGAGPSAVTASKIAVVFQNRLILLNNVEGGTTYRGRGRWSRASAYETYDTADFADAPSEMGAIVTAEFVASRLFVGFENGWMELVYTRDERELFRWEKTTFVFGAASRRGSIPDGPRILTRTVNGIQAIDPNMQYAADGSIPDYVVSTLDAQNADFCSAKRVLASRQVWWSVMNSEATASRPNEIMVGQYQEDRELRWSAYSVPFNAFGDWTAETTPTLDDVDVPWDDYDIAWDSSAGLAGYPITLCGHADGVVYQYGGTVDKINDTPRSGTDAIQFSATSERLTPYPGMRSHLGWVDFYIEASASTELTVSFRGDTDETAYLTKTVSVTPSGTYQKVFRRIRVDKVSTFHRMTIEAVGGGTFAIDAIIPWFRPAGRMRNFG